MVAKRRTLVDDEILEVGAYDDMPLADDENDLIDENDFESLFDDPEDDEDEEFLNKEDEDELEDDCF